MLVVVDSLELTKRSAFIVTFGYTNYLYIYEVVFTLDRQAIFFQVQVRILALTIYWSVAAYCEKVTISTMLTTETLGL